MATGNKTLEDKRAVLFQEGISKVRRFWLVKARREYVSKHRQHRVGECARCALCCKILMQCPFLRENRCAIYGQRFEQCRAFPIDRNDIALIRKMGGKCGFSFSDNGK